MSRHALVFTALLLSGCPSTLACPPGTFIEGTTCVPEGDAGVTDAAIATDTLEPAPDVPADDAPIDVCPTHTYFLDVDHDGFGITTMSMTACAAPSGFVEASGDCDDARADVHPMATEICDMAMLDEDCDATRNEGCECWVGQTRACPGESDVGECVAGTQTCEAGRWAATCAGTVRPASERCDGLDNDCDTMVDGPAADGTCATWPNGSPRCLTGGICGGVCGAGYADCSAGAGCETMLGTTAACTACGDTCNWRCGSASTGCDDPVAVTLGVGAPHTVCAPSELGSVFCWGDGSSGEIVGGTGAVVRPLRSVGLSGRVLDVATGTDHTCAIVASGTATSGTVYCWGANGQGQLGDGTTTARSAPTRTSVTNAVDVAAGFASTCAVLAGGAVQCWGLNSNGQIGDGTTTRRPSPTTVLDVSGATRIDGFTLRFCAVNGSGDVVCWGSGHTGRASFDLGSSRAIAVAVGLAHTCALTTSRVYCWGEGSSGQLGDGTAMDSTAPREVSGTVVAGATPSAIAAGANHTCVVSSDGTVRCWGVNTSGQLGDGSTSNRTAPTAVGGLSGVRAIDGGESATCAVETSGRVQCWGSNGGGELGDGTTTAHSSPRAVLAPL